MDSYGTNESFGSDLTRESDGAMNSSVGVGLQLHGSNMNGFTSTYQQQQPIFTKPHGFGYGPTIEFMSGQVNTHGVRDGFMGNLGQGLPEKNMSLVPTVAAFPLLDGNNDDSSLISPSPYIFKGGNIVKGRKRKNALTMETQVLDKTLRRKIKNRESAARSRARKEAHTMQLETELEILKKENELLEKQAMTSKMQTNPGMINLQGRPERKLRRTQSDIK